MKNKERILLIEDVGVFAQVMIDTLKHSYIVDVARNVEEAKTKLDSNKYYYVISDLGKEFDRRSKIMEMNFKNCCIPLLILNKKPDDLSFCDKLGTEYSPITEEIIDHAQLFQEKIRSLGDGIKKLQQICKY